MLPGYTVEALFTLFEFQLSCSSGGKESTCKVGDLGSIPGLGRSPEGGRINSSQIFLPGESPPWTEEPGGVQAMGSQRLRHDLVTKSQQI